LSILGWILFFSLVGGVLSVIAAAGFLVLPQTFRNRILPYMVSFAIGSLLGAAFLALIPHAMNSNVEAHQVSTAVLAGLLLFFILEKLVLWRHCHTEACEVHGAGPEHEHEPDHGHGDHGSGNRAATLVLIGDGFHNLVDGVLIAAAFLTDFHLGVVTALAVAAHEIPQEVGDFAILLHSGYSRSKAFFFNILSSLTTVVGALAAYWSLSDTQDVLPYIIAIAAASFIYVAVADLIPDLHRKSDLKSGVQQLSLILAGVVVIYLAHSSLH
jgi:zinc and cadmium transporter